jgi:hypothetical protein
VELHLLGKQETERALGQIGGNIHFIAYFQPHGYGSIRRNYWSRSLQGP